MSNQKTLESIKYIIDICEDGAEGYDKAATHLDSSHLQTLFHRLSQQRSEFAQRLINDCRELGGVPEAEGTLKGYFHQRWIDAKTAITERPDKDIVREAKIGEESAIEAYQKALSNEDIPQFIKAKMEEQMAMIENARHELEELKAA